MDLEKIDVMEEIFRNKIYQQINNIILQNEEIYKNNNNNIKETNNSNNEKNRNENNTNENNKNDNSKLNSKKTINKKDTFKEKEKSNKTSMAIIVENAPEEEENDLFEGRGTVIQKNIGEEFDFTNNIINGINEYLKDAIAYGIDPNTLHPRQHVSYTSSKAEGLTD